MALIDQTLALEYGVPQTETLIVEDLEWTVTYQGGEPVPPEGLTRTVQWAPVRGATSVVLDGQTGETASIAPAIIIEDINTVSVDHFDKRAVIKNLEKKPYKQLTLRNLRRDNPDNPELTSFNDLRDASVRLLVATRETNQDEWVPLFSVPRIEKKGEIPPMLEGATFSNRILSFPYTLNSQIRISLVTQETLEDFDAVNMFLGQVSGKLNYVPTDVQLTLGESQLLWEMPGSFALSMPAGSVGVRVPIELALKNDLQAAIDENRDIETALTLTGGANSSVIFSFAQPSGAVLREHPDVLRTVIEGEDEPFEIEDDFDVEMPDSVVADLYVRYDGLRILEELSDMAPIVGTSTSGQVVRTTPVTRELPAEGLMNHDVAKIGLIGWSHEGCELDVQFTSRDGQLIGEAGRVTLIAEATPAIHWVDMPPRNRLDQAVHIQVSARSGQFFWVSQDHPLLRIVIRDPNPDPHDLFIDDTFIAQVPAEGIDIPGLSLPVHAFTGSTPGARPHLSSSLFLTVDFTALTLRYNR